MKNFLKTIYIFLFMLIGFLPMLLYGVQSYFGDVTEEYSIEKSKTLELPSVFSSDGINMDFDDEFEGWLNQNIPFRGYVVSFIDRIFSTLLKEPVANVVTGNNGWLYSEETIDNYQDTNPLSNEEIQNIAITLSLIEERVEEQGGNFIFVPVPNKNSIYPEYMPMRYIRANSNNLSRLCEELDAQGVDYADIKGELLAAKDEMNLFDLYYKGDTHWTNLGARVGYNTIMEGLNKAGIPYEIYTLTNASCCGVLSVIVTGSAINRYWFIFNILLYKCGKSSSNLNISPTNLSCNSLYNSIPPPTESIFIIFFLITSCFSVFI